MHVKRTIAPVTPASDECRSGAPLWRLTERNPVNPLLFCSTCIEVHILNNPYFLHVRAKNKHKFHLQ